MKTEITENNKRQWVLYDGSCPICKRWIGRIRGPLTRHGFELAPQQSDFGREVLKLQSGQTAAEVKVLTPELKLIGGIDALVVISRFVWWMRPLSWIARIPGAMRILRPFYAWIAKHRYCFGGVCETRL